MNLVYYIKKVKIPIASLIFVILFVIIISSYSLNTFSRQTYDQQKSAIEKQRNDINSILNNNGRDLENASLLKSTLKAEIESKEKSISDTDKLIIQVNDLIKNIDIQIAQNQKDIDGLVDQMKLLLVELQKQGQITPLESVLSSENLADAISKLYSISSLQSKADIMRQDLEKKSKELSDNKTKQEEARVNLEQSRALLASQRSTLENLKNKTQNDENKYSQYRDFLIKQQNELDARMAVVKQKQIEEQKRIDEENKNKSSVGNSSSSGSVGDGGGGGGGGGCWFEDKRDISVPSGYFQKPTSGNIERIFNNCIHNGADISNSIGTPLYAIADATVVQTESLPYAYGNYIVLKVVLPSGDRIYALYAHMSIPSFRKVGETVKKGDVVGYMGSTGNSTGSHLHFSIFSDKYEIDGMYGPIPKVFNPTKFINPIG